MANLGEKIEEVLNEKIRPMLEMHGGGVEVVKIDEKKGIVEVKFKGMCIGCPSAGMTFHSLIEHELMDKIPELKKVTMA